MEYLLTLKLIHILGATVLFGTGLGIAFFMVMAHRTRDPVVIAHTASIVVLADAMFTANAVIVQPVSGVYLALGDRLFALGPVDRRVVGALCPDRRLLAAGALDPGADAQSRAPGGAGGDRRCRLVTIACSASGSCSGGRPSSA